MKVIRYFAIVLLLFNLLFAQSYGRRFLPPVVGMGKDEQDVRFPVEPEQQIFSLETAINPDEYIVGPGDILGINIITTQNFTFTLTVGPTGELLIPSVGAIDINGKSLLIAQNEIKDFISCTYTNAKVSVTLLNIRNFKVQVIGAVNSPGFIDVTPITRLDQIIDEVEGFHQFAEEYNIKITRANGTTESVNFLKYLTDGKLTNNPTFLEGDRIFVPFGDVDKEGVVIRGSIAGSGYDIIQKGETLGDFLFRRAKFSTNADLESVTITRMENGKELFMTVFPKDFHKTVLKPGDAIDILRERGISVNGFVQAPGGFSFFPGYTYLDYINMAGGNTAEGDVERAIVRHLDGTIEKGKEAEIKRGDVIIVPQTRIYVLFGDMSVLQVLSAVTSVVLTFIAATSR
ncbi:MAG: SLBB domain-containing protein [Candidatus Marinimicrobia bacterium]|nr:SLBB domain-containing protein [Candidatus Neomarinimicrobiota bacterium]